MDYDSQNSDDAINWFRNASPYINAHSGKTVVLCIPDQMLDSEKLHTLIYDLTLLSHLGLRLVISFGLRAQVDAQLKIQQAVSQVIDGLRVTDDAALNEIITQAGQTRIKLEAMLSTGLPNTPMAGAHLAISSGNFVTAQPFGIHDGVDYLHTGSVRQVHTDAINQQLSSGHLVILPPIGYSLTGETFNVSAEEVATAAAVALKADKLIFFVSDLPKDSKGTEVRESTLKQLDKLASLQEEERLQRSLKKSAYACNRGVGRVHLLKMLDSNALLRELFTRDGGGTLITAERWENNRRAGPQDIAGIFELIKPLQQNGTLLWRSEEQIELALERFVVCERDGTVVACAALMPIEDADAAVKSAEIVCVATHPDYRGQGRAEGLISQLESRAKTEQVKRLFLLTTRTAHWFIERGYVEHSKESLPASRQGSYNEARNSKVFVKDLF